MLVFSVITAVPAEELTLSVPILGKVLPLVTYKIVHLRKLKDQQSLYKWPCEFILEKLQKKNRALYFEVQRPVYFHFDWNYPEKCWEFVGKL